MKSNIHPTWHDDAKVTCSCGNSFTTGSVDKSIEVDICNKCHPFFTGELKFVDRQGRVERFRAKMEKAQNNPRKKKAKKTESNQADPKSYQELLREQQTNLKKAAKSQAKQTDQPVKKETKPAAKTSATDDKSADK